VGSIKLLIILPLSGVCIKINYTKSSSECCTFNKVQIKTRLLVLWSEQSLECCKTVVAGRAFESLSRNNCPQIKVISSSNVHLHYIILHVEVEVHNNQINNFLDAGKKCTSSICMESFFRRCTSSIWVQKTIAVNMVPSVACNDTTTRFQFV
jgi:hypothetical protein